MTGESFATVERHRHPALEACVDCAARQQPLHVVGAVAAWPAVTRWTPEHLRRACGQRRVRAHVSTRGWVPQAYFGDPAAYERASGGEQMAVREMTFAECIDGVFGDFTRVPPGVYALPGYPLDELDPVLTEEIETPAYATVVPDSRPNFWFGPRGKTVPLHRDGVAGVLAQVTGRKLLHLVAARESSWVYPHPRNRFISEVADVTRADAARFPLFARATVLECLLEPGDLLLIPRGWWHQVRYLEPSISVNYWPRSYLASSDERSRPDGGT